MSVPKMRIKRDITITWEMSEDIAYSLLDVLEEADPQGHLSKEHAVSLSLDSLRAALPHSTEKE